MWTLELDWELVSGLTQPTLNLGVTLNVQLALSEPQFSSVKQKEAWGVLQRAGHVEETLITLLGLGLAPQTPCPSIPGCGDPWGQLAIQNQWSIKGEPGPWS